MSSEDPEDDHVGTVVVRGDYQEYFDVVKGEITRELEMVTLNPKP